MKSKAFLVCTAIAAAALACGCVRNSVVVRVNKDGTGNIIVTRIFSKEAVSMVDMQMASMREQMAAAGGSVHFQMPDDPFYNEEALRQEAGQFGPGVTFVKARKYEKDGARGSIALYAFDNINDVFMNSDSAGGVNESALAASMGAGGEAAVAKRGEDAFGFTFTPGDVARLAIDVPEMADAEAGEGDAAADAEDLDMAEAPIVAPGLPNPEPAMGGDMGSVFMGAPMGMGGDMNPEDAMKAMLKGMYLSVAVEVAGEPVETSATFRHPTKPNRFVLVELDMNRLMESMSDADLMRMMSGSGSPDDFFSSLGSAKGAVIETNRQVVIQFK